MGPETSPTGALAAFLLAFPALFSIINPIGGALIFSEVTAGRSHAERAGLARSVGFYSFCVLLASIWAGSYVLNFFGITLGALRVAGGIVVAIAAWRLLMSAEQEHSRKDRRPPTRANARTTSPSSRSPSRSRPGRARSRSPSRSPRRARRAGPARCASSSASRSPRRRSRSSSGSPIARPTAWWPRSAIPAHAS